MLYAVALTVLLQGPIDFFFEISVGLLFLDLLFLPLIGVRLCRCQLVVAAIPFHRSCSSVRILNLAFWLFVLGPVGRGLARIY